MWPRWRSPLPTYQRHQWRGRPTWTRHTTRDPGSDSSGGSSPRTFVQAFGERNAIEQSPVNLEFQGTFLQNGRGASIVDLRDTARDASRLNVAYGSLVEASPIVNQGTVSTLGVVVNQILTRE